MIKTLDKLAKIQHLINEFCDADGYVNEICGIDTEDFDPAEERRKIFTQYCIEIGEQLEALEIIVSKKLNLFEFYLDFIDGSENYVYYQCHHARYHLEMLTQNEFDFLIKVLKEMI